MNERVQAKTHKATTGSLETEIKLYDCQMTNIPIISYVTATVLQHVQCQ